MPLACRRSRRRIALLALAALLFAPAVRAHVEYVAEDTEETLDPWTFLWDVATEPANALLLVAGAGALLVAAAVAFLLRRRLPDVRALVRTLESYRDLVPWMLRLSVGLPLVGAGFAGYLYAPVVPVSLRIPQVLVGFLILFGLATRAAAAAGLAGYLATFALYGPDVLLAGEFVPGFLAILLLGAGRPSADEMLDHVASQPGNLYHGIDPVHRLGAWFRARVEGAQPYIPTLVRVGLGATFVYLGVAEKLLQPGVSMAVLRDLGLEGLLPIDPRMWVIGAAGVEALVGLALLAGVLTRATAALAFLVLTSTLLGLPEDPVLPHISLFGLTSAVFTMGAGPWSVDRWLAARSEKESTRRSGRYAGGET